MIPCRIITLLEIVRLYELIKLEKKEERKREERNNKYFIPRGLNKNPFFLLRKIENWFDKSREYLEKCRRMTEMKLPTLKNCEILGNDLEIDFEMRNNFN